MADFVYEKSLDEYMKGTLDLDAAGDDIRAGIAMSSTTLDTETEIEFVGSATTLDRHDGANYPAQDGQLAGEAVAEDLPNSRAEFDATDHEFTALGVGTRVVAGVFIYKFVTNDAASPLLIWIDTPTFPEPNGGNWTLQWDPQGILQLS
jgi:hypothetical protein